MSFHSSFNTPLLTVSTIVYGVKHNANDDDWSSGSGRYHHRHDTIVTTRTLVVIDDAPLQDKINHYIYGIILFILINT